MNGISRPSADSTTAARAECRFRRDPNVPRTQIPDSLGLVDSIHARELADLNSIAGQSDHLQFDKWMIDYLGFLAPPPRESGLPNRQWLGRLWKRCPLKSPR